MPRFYRVMPKSGIIKINNKEFKQDPSEASAITPGTNLDIDCVDYSEDPKYIRYKVYLVNTRVLLGHLHWYYPQEAVNNATPSS